MSDMLELRLGIRGHMKKQNVRSMNVKRNVKNCVSVPLGSVSIPAAQ